MFPCPTCHRYGNIDVWSMKDVEDKLPVPSIYLVRHVYLECYMLPPTTEDLRKHPPVVDFHGVGWRMGMLNEYRYGNISLLCRPALGVPLKSELPSLSELFQNPCTRNDE